MWYDRALTAVCPPAWPEEVQLTPGASVSALKGREAEPANRGRADADAHERKFLDFGKFADTRTCIRPSVRARGGKTLRQSSGIYHTERYNSQQNESFDINGLVCIFCITVNISFTVYAQVAWIYIQGNRYFQCKCQSYVHVPFLLSKLFSNKCLGIQKQWRNEERSSGRYEMHAVRHGRYDFKRQD